MKPIHHVAAVALAVVAAVITVMIWNRGEDAPQAPATSTGSATAVAPAANGDAASTPPSTTTNARVRVMSREDRQRLREQIAASIKRRAAAAGTSSPASGSGASSEDGDLPTLALEDAGPELRGGLQDAIAHLADCYPHDAVPDGGSGKRAAAMMTLITDPELGTVIDTERVTDEAGAPLPEALETCMRDAIETLALPGLDKPGALPLQYTFVFD